MAGETLEAKVVRFEGNEQRFNTLVNGGPGDTWSSTGGTELPSVQKFFADTEALYDNAVLVADHAKMVARLPIIADGSVVEVQKDETVGYSRTRYKVEGGSAVFLVNMDLWFEFVKRTALIYQGYATASAAAASLPDEQVVEAPDADGRLSRFAVQSGALEFVGYVDQLRYDLSNPADGAGLSGYMPGISYERGTVGAALDMYGSLIGGAQASGMDEQIAASYLRYRVRGLWGRGQGFQCQGFAVDEVTGNLFIKQVHADGSVIVSRFRVDGPVNQAALDDMTAPVAWGHQSMSIQRLSGVPYFWAPSTTFGQAIRCPYIAGDSPAYESFTFFPAATSELTLTTSSDGRFLAARTDQSSGNSVKIYRLGDLAAPGDYTNAYIAQFILQGSAYALQDMHISGGVLYTINASATTSTPSEIRGYSISSGEIVYRNLNVTIGLADAQNTGQTAEGGGTYYEAEGLSAIGGKLAPLYISGDASRKATRIYVVGGTSDYETWLTNKALKVFDPHITLSQKATIREALSALVRQGFHEKLNNLFICNAPTSAMSRINWMDPEGIGLIQVGTGAIWTAAGGYTGTGDLTNYMQVGNQGVSNIVGFDRDRASFGVYCDPTVGNGPVIGNSINSPTTGLFMNPYEVSGNHAFSIFGALPVFSGYTAEQMRGLSVCSRTARQLSAYHGGTTISSQDVAYSTPNIQYPVLLRSTTTTSTRQVQALFMGGDLTLAQYQALRAIIHEIVSLFGSAVPDDNI